MNMQKNAKKSLGNRGFSLVELIVVIAIMAILAAVAVVGVSVYVDKASEAADKQTIMDIEDALVMGAYGAADKYAPGTVVGVVGISKDDDARAGNEDIAQMLEDAFGVNWEKELHLQSDVFVGMDSAKVLDAIREDKKTNGANSYFNSLSGSSYYGQSDSTGQLADDVDRVAAALSGVLNGMKPGNVHNLWGDTFKETIKQNGLNETYKTDDELAANLTVFAAANSISSTVDKSQLINGWTNGGDYGGDADMVTPLVMNFAKCTALKNWVELEYGKDSQEANHINAKYENLMAAMENLKNLSEGESYPDKFDEAIRAFWGDSGVAQLYSTWPQEQMKKDAEAFIATMTTVNKLESTYVTTDKVEVLDDKGAFTEFGAAEILDNMVLYSQIDLPEGDYFITLVIDENGVPTIVPALSRN